MALSVMTILQIASMRAESQTVDEGVHLTAGYSYWRTGDYRLNPEHPPLAKLVASVPLLFFPIHLPLEQQSWSSRDEWAFARDFLYTNDLPADTILFAGRCAMLLFSLGLGVLIALWARKIWGDAGGMLTIVLYAFDPSFLSHGHYITTDVPLTLFFGLTILAFGWYLERPSMQRFILFASAFAFAQLTKYSALILWPIILLLWMLHGLWRRADHTQRQPHSMIRFFGALLLITFCWTWLFYGLQVQRPMEDWQLAQQYQEPTPWQVYSAANLPTLARWILDATDPSTVSGQRVLTFFRTFPIPAYSYLRGITNILWHNYWGHGSYLLGQYRDTGWWYYFPVAFFAKTPAALFVIFLLAFLAALRSRVEKIFRRTQTYPDLFSDTTARTPLHLSWQTVLLTVPPLFYLLFSMSSSLNIGVRHIFPIYPFLFVGAAGLVRIRFWGWRHKLWRTVSLGLLIVYAASSLRAFPLYTAYFSELVGGAANGSRYLVDSNLDWGQDLKRLQQYLDARGIPFVGIAYFGQAPLAYYLRDYRSLPANDDPVGIANFDGWAAISVTALFSEDGAYRWLRVRSPDAHVGHSIFLYDLRKER